MPLCVLTLHTEPEAGMEHVTETPADLAFPQSRSGQDPAIDVRPFRGGPSQVPSGEEVEAACEPHSGMTEEPGLEPP